MTLEEQILKNLLFRYSEWLDGQGDVFAPPTDSRSHDELVDAFWAAEVAPANAA